MYLKPLTGIGNEHINLAKVLSNLGDSFLNLCGLGYCRTSFSALWSYRNPQVTLTINLVSERFNIMFFGQVLCLLNCNIISIPNVSQFIVGGSIAVWVTDELYHRATWAPASAIDSATEYPRPSAAPVTMTTFPFIWNCCKTLVGVSGNGRGKPSRAPAQS